MDAHDDKIQSIVESAVNNIKQASEVSTVVGKPIRVSDSVTILPLSQISFAFVAGGGDYGEKKKRKLFGKKFAGGTGGGAVLTPIGFLAVNKDDIRLINISGESCVDKIVGLAKELFDNVKKS